MMRGILDFIEDMTEEIKWKLEDTVEEVKCRTTDIVHGLSEFPGVAAEIKVIGDNAIEESIEIFSPNLATGYRKIKNFEDSINNVYDSWTMGIIRELFIEGVDSVAIGDHLFVDWPGFTHHAVYIGEGKVVHYSDGIIKKANLKEFSKGYKIHKKPPAQSPATHNQEVIVKRAVSRIGECNYHLFHNNCENFVRWCRRGV